MNYTVLTPDFAAAPQIGADDLAAIAALGYRSVMCNRPDGEDPGQADFAVIEEAAKAQGLVSAHVPVVSGQITPEDVEKFRAAIAALPQPVFAYCRSGTRCRILWQMTQ